MPIEELEHFILEQNNDHIDVKFKFRIISPLHEKEIVSLLNTAYFGVKSDIRLFLGDLEYIDNKINLTLLSFGREMAEANRTLTLNKPPAGLRRFIERLGLTRIVGIEG